MRDQNKKFKKQLNFWEIRNKYLNFPKKSGKVKNVFFILLNGGGPLLAFLVSSATLEGLGLRGWNRKIVVGIWEDVTDPVFAFCYASAGIKPSMYWIPCNGFNLIHHHSTNIFRLENYIKFNFSWYMPILLQFFYLSRII